MRRALVLLVLVYLSGCGSLDNSTNLQKREFSAVIGLTLPEGYSPGRLSSRLVSSRRAMPAYVTRAVLKITGEDILPVTTEISLDTGTISGSIVPGTYLFSVVVDTNLGVTFVGSTVVTLEPDASSSINIKLKFSDSNSENGDPENVDQSDSNLFIKELSVDIPNPKVGESVNLYCEAEDPDGGEITYSWSGSDGWSASGKNPSYVVDSTNKVTFTCVAKNATGDSVSASLFIDPLGGESGGSESGGDGSGDSGTGGGGSGDGGTGDSGSGDNGSGDSGQSNANPIIQEVSVDISNPDVGDSVSLNCEADDPDGDEITYSWSGSDGWSASGQEASYTVQNLSPVSFTCSVSDGNGGSASGSVSITPQ